MDGDQTWRDVQFAGEKLYKKYEENLTLLFDAISNLRRAFGIRPRGHPEGCASLKLLGRALSERYHQQGDLHDLTDAIACYREALQLCPIAERSSFLDHLAAALKSRYERRRDLDSLSEAIACYLEVLQLRSLGDPDRPPSLNGLASALIHRWERHRVARDINNAIVHNREALRLCPPDDPYRHTCLNSLANELHMRYELGGALGHLTCAIAYHREALQLRPIGHPNRVSSLNNISISLTRQYERQGEQEDLTQAISYLREALQLQPNFHPDQFRSLNNLAAAFEIRCEREKTLNDITIAITYYREALQLCPVGHPDRPVTVINLANGLQTRYEREGNLADLDEAIEYHKEALQLRPIGDSECPTSFNDLAKALTKDEPYDWQIEKDPDYLSHAVIYRQEALQLCSTGHLNRFISLNNIFMAFHLRYEREGNLEAFSNALAYLREARTLRPLGHSQRPAYLDRLSVVLWERYERQGDSQALSNAIEYLREALRFSSREYTGHPRLLNTLALVLCARHKQRGNPGDLANAIAHGQEALDLRPVGHPDRFTSLNSLANALRMRYERDGQPKDLSDAITYHQEALKLRPVGHPDRSISLKDLAGGLFIRLKRAGDFPDLTPDGAVHDCSLSDWSAESIIALLREASQSENCSPPDRLSAALEWIRISKDVDPSSTLEAYTSALRQRDLSLVVAYSHHDQLLTDGILRATQDLGLHAATWAIQRGDLEYAVSLLERGRSLLLAQVGPYPVELDDLRRVDSEMAIRFTKLRRRPDASVVSDQAIDETNWVVNDPDERSRNASSKWNRTVKQMRALPGFKMFLKPTSYEHLRIAAIDGPIVILVPGQTSSEVLIVRENAPIHRIKLPLAGSDWLTKLSNDFTLAVASDNEHVNAEGLCVASLRSLWDTVVGPIAHVLQDVLRVPSGSRIWWCPTSAASCLPLHAAGTFMNNDPEESFSNIYISSYTSTLQTLIHSRQRTNTVGQKKLLVVSQPETPDEPPLPGAEEEVAAIKNILASTRDIKTLSGEAGTCEAVQRETKDYPWIHFACHGITAQRHPLDSYISLHDGHLTLHKIAQEIAKQGPPNTDLVFLSACHSRSGDHDLANEVLHLAATMQLSGFRGVVGSLWATVDDDGLTLTEVFYRETIRSEDSRGAAVALSEGIKHLRRKNVPINRWMRFVHIGI